LRVIDSIKIDLFEEILKKEGHLGLMTVGMSMLPTIRPGDLLTVAHCTIDEIHVNDIVVIKKDGGLIHHRVYKIELNKARPDLSVVYTKGDSNLIPDAPTKASAVIAKVISFKKKTTYHFIPGFLLKLVRGISSFLHHRLTQIHESVYKKTFYKLLINFKNRSFFRKLNMQCMKKPLHNFSQMKIGSYKKVDDSL